MIGISDIVILAVASTALALGVFRWHQNTQDVSSITIPASSRTVVSSGSTVTSEPTLVSSVSNANLAGSNGLSATSDNLNIQPQVQVQTVQTAGAAVTSTASIDASNAANTVQTNDQSNQLSVHVVVAGDYLSRIAQQYGTDVATLRSLNGISGSLIVVGQEILYPAR